MAKTNANINPLDIIKTLKETVVGGNEMIEIYTSGGCYKLYQLLKIIFPQAEAWFTIGRSHIVTKIDNKFYDIKGEVKLKYLQSPSNIVLKLTEEDHKNCKRWVY